MVESQNRVHRQVFHINKDKRSSRRQPNARDEDNATWNILLTTARMRRGTLKAASPPPAQKTSSHFIPPHRRWCRLPTNPERRVYQQWYWALEIVRLVACGRRERAVRDDQIMRCRFERMSSCGGCGRFAVVVDTVDEYGSSGRSCEVTALCRWGWLLASIKSSAIMWCVTFDQSDLRIPPQAIWR